MLYGTDTRTIVFLLHFHANSSVKVEKRNLSWLEGKVLRGFPSGGGGGGERKICALFFVVQLSHPSYPPSIPLWDFN